MLALGAACVAIIDSWARIKDGKIVFLHFDDEPIFGVAVSDAGLCCGFVNMGFGENVEVINGNVV